MDEWNIWYRATNENKLEEIYNLKDALVVAMHFNAFIRHAAAVKMANIAQIVNAIAPILTDPDSLVLQSTFFPFEIYRKTCGGTSLDVHWTGDTFSTPEFSGLRILDLSATLDETQRKLTLYAVNRNRVEGERHHHHSARRPLRRQGTDAHRQRPRHQSIEHLRGPRQRHGP